MSVFAPVPSPVHVHGHHDMASQHHHVSSQPSSSSSAVKRKAEDSAECDVASSFNRDADASTSTTETDSLSDVKGKKRKKIAAVELDDKFRPRFKQGPFSLNKHSSTLLAIAQFQEWLSGQSDLSKIPSEHLHVVAKIIQESNASISALSKEVLEFLCPQSVDSDDSQGTSTSLTVGMVSKAINAIAERRNYGLSISDIANDCEELAGKSESSLPASHPLRKWSFYCWEVNDLSQVTEDAKLITKIAGRREERETIREQILELYESLPAEPRASLLSLKMRNRKSGEGSADGKTTEKSINRSQSRSPSKSPAPSKKKEESPEKLEKKQQRKEAKEAKEEQKKKLDRDLKRSAASLSSFFLKKQKARQDKAEGSGTSDNPAPPTPSGASAGAPLTAADASISPEQVITCPSPSDFHKVFYPASYKDLAPSNRCNKTQVSSRTIDEQLASSVEQSATELLSSLQKSFVASTRSRVTAARGIHPRVSVSQVMKLLSESDTLGGDAADQAKRELERLKDPSLVRYKLLQFHTDRRPAWFGTYTKSSNFVRARNPLCQDPVTLDYSYDSDDGWLSDAGDADADDLQQFDDDDQEAGSDDDTAASEADSWLEDDMQIDDDADEGSLDTSLENEVDDDIIEVDSSGKPIAAPPVNSPLAFKGSAKPRRNFLKNKLKARNNMKRKKRTRQLGRRFESKLVPFSTGPHWETTFGVASYPNFQPYCVEFLNDAYFGLDPFTYVSAEAAIESANVAETDAAAPAPMPPAKAASIAAAPSSDGSSDGVTVLIAKRSRPKQPFPADLVPHLLRWGEDSTRSSKILLVEDLREKFAQMDAAQSKAAIDAAVIMHLTKTGSAKNAQWKVKDEYKHLLEPGELTPAAPNASDPAASCS